MLAGSCGRLARPLAVRHIMAAHYFLYAEAPNDGCKVRESGKQCAKGKWEQEG